MGDTMSGSHLNPIPAALVVVVAAAASVGLVWYIYRREVRKPPSGWLLVIVGLWFLVSFGLTTFLIRVR